jgi:outer membrane protein OmpA-like peptidoglycan-associated protein
VWMYHADNFYQEADYHNALLNYQKALSDSVGMEFATIPYEITQSNLKVDKSKKDLDTARTVPLKDYLRHQIAMCYMKTYDYPRAVEHFQNTADMGSYPEDLYYYGVAQMNNNDHEGAVRTFEKYIASDKYNDSLLRSAQLLITGCYYAMDDNNVKKKVEVNQLDTTVFNKGTSSFAPMFFGSEDRLMFTSARDGGVIFDPEKQVSAFLCDLYWTERDQNGNWTEAKNFGRPLNSAQHDASSSLNELKSAEHQSVLYYTRWNDGNRKEQAIHLSRMVDFKFYESFKLPESVNVPGYRSINPFVSLDGRKLYFSSDRPGGEGGLDLWFIELDEAGLAVGEAKNLGRPVNSELDEQSPFFHEASSTLFFSSNGHNSIGGLDLFKASFSKENKAFNAPENLGLPINSSMDDSYLIWDTFLNKGYFASDRAKCENGHCFDIYEITNEPIRIALEGYVYDIETEEILANANLKFKDIDFKFEDFTIQTDENGYYYRELDQNQEIFIKASMSGYFADANSVSTKPITTTTTLIQDFYLRPIPTEEIEIEGIEYDFDKATLRPESKEILDKLYEFLNINSNLIVEINSHTDYRGSDSYNMNLSKRRAQSCVDYLISKGIPKERLTAKGYGESQPNYLKGSNGKSVIGNDGKRIYLTKEYIDAEPSEDVQEEYHQRNRRTSFKVVGEGFNLESN